MRKKLAFAAISLLSAFIVLSCEKQGYDTVPAENIGITMSVDGFKSEDGNVISVPELNGEISPAGLFAVIDGKIIGGYENIMLDVTSENNKIILNINEETLNGLPLEADYFIYWPYSGSLTFTPDPSKDEAEGFFQDLAGKWETQEDQSRLEDFMNSLLMYGTSRIVDGQLDFKMEHAMGLLQFELPGIKYQFTNEDFDIADYDILYDGSFENVIPYRADDGQYLFLTNPENEDKLSGKFGQYDWSIDNTAANGECRKVVIGNGLSIREHCLKTGDFFCSDGSLISKDAPKEEVAAANVVGMVFQIDPARIGNGERLALGGTAHGLVVACKVAADGKLNAWYSKDGESSRDETEIGLENILVNDDAYATYQLANNDIEGYRNNTLIRTERKEDYDNGCYPAFKTAEDFGKEAGALSTTGTTGWYLPSNGQLLDVARNLGGATLDDSNLSDWGKGDFYWLGIGPLQYMLDAAMEKVAPEQKTSFYIYSYQWTSSAASETGARYFDFYDDEVYCNNLAKSHEDPVRCVLAF